MIDIEQIRKEACSTLTDRFGSDGISNAAKAIIEASSVVTAKMLEMYHEQVIQAEQQNPLPKNP